VPLWRAPCFGPSALVPHFVSGPSSRCADVLRSFAATSTTRPPLQIYKAAQHSGAP